MSDKPSRLSVDFFISELPLSMNVILRTHWTKLRREQEYWNLAVGQKWNLLGRRVFTTPVRVKYALQFKPSARRKRDYDNYLAGTKYVTDALKRTFLFRDDSDWLKEVALSFSEGEPGTHVYIEESE